MRLPKVQYEAETDLAYIQLVPDSERRNLVDQRPILDRNGPHVVHIVLDVDSQGRIAGIEVPGASVRLSSELLETADQLGDPS